MALNFNEVLHPRTGLLVIRQTSLEPTLKNFGRFSDHGHDNILHCQYQYLFIDVYGGVELGS